MCVVPRAASREQGQAVGRMPPCACEPPSVASGGGQTYMYKWMRVPFRLEPRREASSHGSLGDRAGGVR